MFQTNNYKDLKNSKNIKPALLCNMILNEGDMNIVGGTQIKCVTELCV